MKKYTDGPWTFHDHDSHFQIRNDGGFPLAEVYGMTSFGRELCEANARLMATAPELLEELENLLSQVARLGTIANTYGIETGMAKNIVAKAKGGAK